MWGGNTGIKILCYSGNLKLTYQQNEISFLSVFLFLLTSLHGYYQLILIIELTDIMHYLLLAIVCHPRVKTKQRMQTFPLTFVL